MWRIINPLQPLFIDFQQPPPSTPKNFVEGAQVVTGYSPVRQAGYPQPPHRGATHSSNRMVVSLTLFTSPAWERTQDPENTRPKRYQLSYPAICLLLYLHTTSKYLKKGFARIYNSWKHKKRIIFFFTFVFPFYWKI